MILFKFPKPKLSLKPLSLKKAPVVLKIYFPLLILLSLLSVFIYTAGQQVLRMTSNDPQVQLAQDIAEQLNNGQSPQAFSTSQPTDITKSLDAYLVIYDSQGKSLAATAVLDGNSPQIPSGVLNTAASRGENRVTWQPRSGVRQALVAVPYKGSAGGVLVVGRSLSETEKRVGIWGREVAAGWLVLSLAALAISYYWSKLLKGKD